MADIFISYSKKHAALTEALALDLEAAGHTTWWDTSLLPGDEFPDEIKRQLDAAKAVIVIWTESSVASKWVRAEATRAHAQGKLIALHEAGLDLQEVPLPFNTIHSELVTERAKIFAALARKKIAPAGVQADNRLPPGSGEEPRAQAKSSPLAREVMSKALRKVGEKYGNNNLLNAANRLQASATEARSKEGKKHDRWSQSGTSFRDFDAGPEMVVVPAGSFMMGSKDGEGDDDERPQHKVTIPQAFAVGKYPVTFNEWDAAVAASGVSYKPGDEGWGRGRRPVINVEWEHAKAYVKWLSDKTGQPYRLLSEAEWEYACRAGTEAAYCFGDSEDDLGRYAWYSANSGTRTRPVGEKAANAFSLHDMHGNVWEWCEDVWNYSYRDQPESLKATGGPWTTRGPWTAVGDARVLRGGSWNSDPEDLRAARRFQYHPDYSNHDVGLRVARTLNR
jgi:formylglycine-generating enzyme required for sulfatase activity